MSGTTILTTKGLTKLASATPEDQLHIAYVAVGDGNGGYPSLLPSMNALTREVWRGVASQPIREDDAPTIVKFESVIPATAGGFVIREIGIFDEDDDLIAISHTALIEKPSPLGETAVTLTATMRVALQNAAQVQLLANDQPYIDHQALENRSANNAHPQSAITGLTTVTEFAGGGDLPASIAGALALRADGEDTHYFMPAVAVGAAEVTIFHSHLSSAHRVYVRGLDLLYPEEIGIIGSSGIELAGPGNWVRLRPNRPSGRWEVVAHGAMQRDPTETHRGIPTEATDSDVATATAGGKMMSPRRVLGMIRHAVANATETLRGVLRVGTQTEVDAGSLDSVTVTPKKLRNGFIFEHTGTIYSGTGFMKFPSWMGGLLLQWGTASFEFLTGAGVMTFNYPTSFNISVHAVFLSDRSTVDHSSLINLILRTDLSSLSQAAVATNNRTEAGSFYFFAIGR